MPDLARAELLRTRAHNLLVFSSNSGHICVGEDGLEVYIGQSIPSDVLDRSRSLHGEGTPMGAIPSGYIVRACVEPKPELASLTLLESTNGWALTAEVIEPPSTLYLGVLLGKVVIADQLNGIRRELSNDTADWLCGIIVPDEP